MGVEDLEAAIFSHLGLDPEAKDDLSWTIKESEVSGRGVFAQRDIPAGEKIFTDRPVIIGPRSRGPVTCAGCLRGVGAALADCPGGCGLQVCKGGRCEGHGAGECARLAGWGPPLALRLFPALAPLRGLDLGPEERATVTAMQANEGPQHGHEVELVKEVLGGEALSPLDEAWIRLCCQVLDSVAFEVETGAPEGGPTARGLYPLAGLLNHSCTPNTRHYFHTDKDNSGKVVYKMTMVASVDINKDEELMNYYCPLLWGTPARRHYLHQTKHFYCQCQRCSDATEFGTYFSGLDCLCGKGRLVPEEPLLANSRWSCGRCQLSLSAKDSTLVQARMARELAEGKLAPPASAGPFTQVTVQLALHSIWHMGLKPERVQDPGRRRGISEGSVWINEEPSREISDEGLRNHEITIRNMLDLIKRLKLGMCRMKGLLLYQLYLAQKEWEKRGNQIDKEECRAVLKEASQILEGDIAAPIELQMLM